MTAIESEFRRPDRPPLPPTARGAGAARPLATPAPSRLLDTDLGAVLGGFAVVVLGLWIRHGEAGRLFDGWLGFWTSLSQLSGLLAAAAGLLGLTLVARPRSVERRYGLDRMFVWHRILGETMAVLVGAHVVAGTAEWAVGGSLWSAVRDATGREPYMAGAFVGSLLVGLVTITSLRSIRRRMAYETWYFVHLLAYVGLALSFSHEIVVGGDLADDRWARTFWVLAHVGVAAWIVWGRWGHLMQAALRPLKVTGITNLNNNTVELRIGGPGIEKITADAGQFMMLRPLHGRLWWQTHPFSLSGAPNTDGLRFTIKARGDASAAMTSLPVGTRVVVEGPYGACTPEVIGDDKVLFVVGGVGIAPVRAMLERLGPSAAPIVLYRAHSTKDLVHLDELQALVAARNGVVHTLVGPTAKLKVKDPFSARVLRKLTPDVAARVAVLCGPERLLHAARAGLKEAGVPLDRIHYERVWW